MLLAVRLKWRRSVVIGQSRPLVKFGSFVMLMSCMSSLYGAGVPADLDPPRIEPPGPNPLADMDPPVHIC